VYSGSTDSGLEAATVWTIVADRAFHNRISVTSGSDVDASESREWFVRVVDTTGTADPSDDTVVDNDGHVLAATDEGPPDVPEDGEMAAKVEQLGTTDSSVGSGLVVFERDGDGNVQFSVVPLRTGEYRIGASCSLRSVGSLRFSRPSTSSHQPVDCSSR